MKVLTPLSTFLLSGSHLDVLWGNLLLADLVAILFSVLFTVTLDTHLSIHRSWPWDCPHPRHIPSSLKVQWPHFSSSPGHLNQLGAYWMVHLIVLIPQKSNHLLEPFTWSKMLGWPKALFRVLKLECPFWSTQ